MAIEIKSMSNINFYFYLKGMPESQINLIKTTLNDVKCIDLASNSLPQIQQSNDDFKIAVIHHSNWNDNDNIKVDRIKLDLVIFLSAGRQLNKYDEIKLNTVSCRWWDNSNDFVINFKLLQEFISKYTDRHQPLTFEKYQIFIAPILPALSILCQGYLIAHSDNSNEFVQQSLAKIVWNDSLFLDTAQKEQMKLGKEEIVVKKWWIDVLNNGREIIGNKIFISRIDSEWNKLEKSQSDRDSLDKLIKKLKSKSQKIDPITVAKAYLAITPS